MQKTLRINLLARNQAVKRARKLKDRNTFDEWKEFERNDIAQERKLRSYQNEERTHRREDWKLGPLAPNRDVGKEKGKFGTIAYSVGFNQTLPQAGRTTPRLPGYNKMSSEEVDDRYPRFRGKTIVGNVVAGDRVVIVQGPARVRGQIGMVSSVDNEREELRINNINIHDVEKPRALIPEPSEDNPNPELFFSQEGLIPIRNVRLVVRDEETHKEYIVSHVHADGPYIQQRFGSNLPSHTRYITGSEHWSKDGLPVEIPWPVDEDADDIRSTIHDTGRQEVEEKSWTPSMYHSPLGYTIEADADMSDPRNAYLGGYAENPSSTPNPLYALGLAGFSSDVKAQARETRIASGIMDELRKKSARTNRNHEDFDWVKRKLMEDARSIWWRDRQIQSPQEIQAQVKNREAREEREARIRAVSEAIASEKAEALSHFQLAAGIAQPTRIYLDKNTEDLIEQIQKTAQGSIYRHPDPKFKRKLKHMI